MATIYRFVVEQQQGSGSSGRKSSGTTKKSAKDKTFTLMGTMGVEHNRKLRAINPVLNKATGGYWEKSMRLGRAGLGLLKFKKGEDGRFAYAGLSSVSLAIIISFALQSAMRLQHQVIQQNEKVNKQNFRKMETGESAIHSSFEVTTQWFTGKRTYNENK